MNRKPLTFLLVAFILSNTCLPGTLARAADEELPQPQQQAENLDFEGQFEIEQEERDGGQDKGRDRGFVFAIVAGSTTLGLSLVALIIYLVWRHEKKRTEALSIVAEQNGLQFSAEKNETLLAKLQAFSLFNKGRGKKMKNVMVAETELARMTIFDYQYTTGGGKNSQTHHHTLMAMESDSLNLPAFSLKPEGFFDRIGAKMGFQDIDFDEHPEFSSAFVLKGKDEVAIRQFFDGPMMDLFVQHKGISVEAQLGLFTYRKGGRKQPPEIRGFMTEGYAFFKALSERYR